VERILAIELLNAAQALDFRMAGGKLRTSAYLTSLHAAFRERVPFVQRDVVMHELMEEALDLLRELPLD
jgi:histidine ammonia-lyase